MKDIKEIINIRHLLHNHPDVSGNESFAHNLIVDFISHLNPTELNTNVGGYGVVAYWKSKKTDAHTIAFRADTDALPLGHCCGHDGHTAIMLRFAEIVAKNELLNNIVLIFQPEEETGKGAQKIVLSGLLQKYNVNAVFALHNLPGYPEGTIVLNQNTFAAASMGVIYRLIGRSTHASTPEKGLNPGLAIAAIIERMSALNNTEGDFRQFRQTTLICCRVGDEAFGTSAGTGEIMFTLRTFTNDTMLDLVSMADKIAVEETERWHLELKREVREPFQATENTPELVERVREILSPGMNVETIRRPMRWSEDFAEYLRVFPGVFFGLGSGEKQPELHNPGYNFPDSIIETGAKCFDLIMQKLW
ncbi:MAG: amidohydrolase [Bacteroidales bacterium]|nr:amidohydrolase [Bacteroidales bacterium]